MTARRAQQDVRLLVGLLAPEAVERLQREWYARLRRGGFVDIERVRGGMLDVSIRTDEASRYGCRTTREITVEYYSQAGAFLHGTRMRPFDRRVWRLHAEGWYVREIAAELEVPRMRVQRVISRLQRQMRTWIRDGGAEA